MAFLSRLVGPLLARELVRLGRSPLSRLALIAGPTLALLLLFALADRVWSEKKLDRQSKAAAQFVSAMFSLTGVVIGLSLPLTLAPALVRERQSGGIAILLTTQVEAPEILLGIAGSAAVVSGLIIASLGPVLMIMALFGGVDAAGVVGSLTILGAEVLCFTAASLEAGVSCRSPLTAVLAAYLVGAVWFFVFGFSLHVGLVQHLAGSPFAPGQSIYWLILAAVVAALIAFFLFILRTFARRLAGNESDYVTRSALPKPPAAEPIKPSSAWTVLQYRPGDIPPTARERQLFWAFFMCVGLPISAFSLMFLRHREGAAVSILLLPIWFVIQFLGVVMAVSNPLLRRRPGLFDDLLATPMSSRELLYGVYATSLPALKRLSFAPFGLGLLWIAANPVGIIVGTLIGFAWLADLFIAGVLFSLVPAGWGWRLTTLAALPLTFAVAATLFGAQIDVSKPTLIGVAAVATIAAVLGARRAANPHSIALVVFSANVAFLSIGAVFAAHIDGLTPTLASLSPFRWMGFCFWDLPSGMADKSSAGRPLVFAAALITCVATLTSFAADRFDALIDRPTRPRA